MKKILFLFVAILFATTVARAADGDAFTYEGIQYHVTSDANKEVEVARNPDASGDLVIPSFVTWNEEQYTVTKIGEHAFLENSGLTSVNLPSTVTEIDKGAFAYCSSLVSVNLPDGLTKIDYGTFERCPSLASVSIPSTVTEIHAYAFLGCSSLTSISIPASVTEIDYSVFPYCTALTEITVDEGNSSYKSEDGVLFNHDMTILVQCPGAKTEYIIPSTVTRILDQAFAGCRLSSITIPSNVSMIDWMVFGNCSILTEIKVDENNAYFKSEDGVLFNHDMTILLQCPAAKVECVIPSSVTVINSNAFRDCINLTSIIIPESVIKIGLGAFLGCINLTSVIIPESVIKIDGLAFQDCINLTSVDIPDSVTEVGGQSFMNCSSLTSVSISKSLTKISYSMFWNCSSLTSVDIPDSVTEIDFQAFLGCTGLTSVSIPNSVTEICGGAFGDCYALKSIVIPSSVNILENGAFASCYNLKKITDLNPEPQEIRGNLKILGVGEDAVIYVPKGSLMKYKVAEGWNYFKDFREIGAFEVSLNSSALELVEGKSAEISAVIEKDDDVTIESEAWTSSDPEVATVDNGVVTAVAEGDAVISYAVVDGYGVPHTATCMVKVIADAGIGEILSDESSAVDVYTMQGVPVLRDATVDNIKTLRAGIYIIRQGKTAGKIVVR